MPRCLLRSSFGSGGDCLRAEVEVLSSQNDESENPYGDDFATFTPQDGGYGDAWRGWYDITGSGICNQVGGEKHWNVPF